MWPGRQTSQGYPQLIAVSYPEGQPSKTSGVAYDPRGVGRAWDKRLPNRCMSYNNIQMLLYSPQIVESQGTMCGDVYAISMR